MFSSDQNIQTLAELFAELKRYGEMRLRLARYDFLSTLVELSSALLLTVVILIIMAVALLFLAAALTFALSALVGGLGWACLIVAAVCGLLAWGVYACRTRLIVQPLAAFLARVLLADEGEGNDTERDSTSI